VWINVMKELGKELKKEFGKMLCDNYEKALRKCC
jgi:hypothetical protein